MGPAGKPGIPGEPGSEGPQGEPGTGGGGGGSGESYTVTFDSNGGGTVNSIAVVAGGWIPREPKPEPAAGLYKATLADTFAFQWVDEDDVPFDFNTPITEDITLKAEWKTAPVAAIAANNLSAAYTYMNTYTNQVYVNAGVYTLLIDDDVEGNGLSLSMGNDLTIMGLGSERTISHNGTPNAAGNITGALLGVYASARLTLEKNLTIKGHVSNSTTYLMFVSANGTLIMKDGAKITGHNTSYERGAIEVGGRFIMEGGEISGNRTSSESSISSGGVYIYGLGPGTFFMSGGTIHSNYNAFETNVFSSSPNPADVSVAYSGGYINLSGTANIDTLTLWSNAVANLTATNSGGQTYVAIGSPYMGKVDHLNLYRSNNPTAATTDATKWQALYDAWLPTTENARTIIRGADGYTLTGLEVARFGLGKFIGVAGVTSRQIAGNTSGDNYYIYNYAGNSVGRLTKR
jgi:hypothetical protein